MYIGWHNHTDKSNYQGRDSIIKVEELIDLAIELGHSGVGITDHSILAAHPKAIRHLDKLKDNIKKEIKEFENKYFKSTYIWLADRQSEKVLMTNLLLEKYKELLYKKHLIDNFKLGLGCEVYLVDKNVVDKAREFNDPTKFYHLILIPKNFNGYRILAKLSSKGWENSFYHRGLERTPIYKHELLEIIGDSKDLICTSACLGSELGTLIIEYLKDRTSENEQKIRQYIEFMMNIFGEDFYIEIQPADNIEQREYNKFAINLAKFYGLKTIVTTDSHYHRPEKRYSHSLFLKSQNIEREVDAFYSHTYMMNEEEIRNLLYYITEEDKNWVLENTIDIYNKIDNIDLYKSTQVPRATIEYDYGHESIFKNIRTPLKYINKFMNSEYLMDRILLQQIEKGLLTNKLTIDMQIINKLEEELESMWLVSEKLGERMSSYYVLTKEIVELMWTISLVGPARGSAGSFFISFCLGIISINPLKYGTLANTSWRHIEKSKISLADIDIDTESAQRENILELVKEKYGHDRVVNICAFITEGVASAIQTICRALQIPISKANYLSSLVVKDGAKVKSIDECLDIYSVDRSAKRFINELQLMDEEYEGFFDAIRTITGVCNGRTIHASGVYLFPCTYTDMNAIMKSPNGQITTQYDMEDSDYQGGLKLDFLTIESLDRIRKTLDLLLKHKKIEWEGTLKATHDKYLHPDNLEYDNPEMWEMLYSGEVVNAFQYETIQGRSALQKIQPQNLAELIAGNSLMRLSCEGEQPIDRFVRYKQNIELAYEEMEDVGLSEEEIKVLESHLKPTYFVADTQESVMLLSMDKDIANFTFSESDTLRKTIAKSNAKDLIGSMRDKFIKSAIASGNRREFAKFVWEKHINPMLGYAFSLPHTTAYSLVLLQEMNLCWRFGSIFWKVACLTVNSGFLSEDKNKGTDYAAIAKAIGDMPRGFVLPPYINKATMEFQPIIDLDKAMYSLSAINGIGDEVAKAIIENRPYYNFNNFLEKCVETKLVPTSKVFQLIKSGCFDKLYRGTREELMKEYVVHSTQNKEKLTSANINKLIECGLIPQHLMIYANMYQFKKMVFSKNNLSEQFTKTNGAYRIPKEISNFYFDNISIIDAEYVDAEGCLCLDKKIFERQFKNLVEPLDKWITTTEAVDRFNNYNRALLWSKYCQGTKEHWEMESICYFTERHELDNVPIENYFKISNFNKLPLSPTVNHVKKWRDRDISIYNLELIAGVVVEKDKKKSTIAISTQFGVVDIKLDKGRFAHYDRVVDEDESWLKRGTKLVLVGYRRGQVFIPKTYKDSAYEHSIMKIDAYNESNILFRFDRKFAKEKMV